MRTNSNSYRLIRLVDGDRQQLTQAHQSWVSSPDVMSHYQLIYLRGWEMEYRKVCKPTQYGDEYMPSHHVSGETCIRAVALGSYGETRCSWTCTSNCTGLNDASHRTSGACEAGCHAERVLWKPV
ncbi:hypothetical protein RRG08_048715 [Elysia crispata]|uniref:Uncharacterized protein n=1 Tax=Elysia crispata TaxID=231223 RepID=A0AAE1AL97_9GAST|nr:hypothetical protein RRG08_048715 [Elysia crispata]